MTVQDMVKDYQLKLNKVASGSYQNLKIPEINWFLNEAQEVFIKQIAMPRFKSNLGFEFNQRTIDDIRTIVEHEKDCTAIEICTTSLSRFKLPENYMFYVASNVCAKQGKCKKKIRAFVQQHDDDFENDTFSKSSFKWEQVNITFDKNGILIHHNGFEVTGLQLHYIRIPQYIHNAVDFNNGSYALPDGQVLTGKQNCELPNHVHREIVDIAVLITTGVIQIPDYQIKRDKLALVDTRAGIVN